jgi:hypothetical protein
MSPVPFQAMPLLPNRTTLPLWNKTPAREALSAVEHEDNLRKKLAETTDPVERCCLQFLLQSTSTCPEEAPDGKRPAD